MSDIKLSLARAAAVAEFMKLISDEKLGTGFVRVKESDSDLFESHADHAVVVIDVEAGRHGFQIVLSNKRTIFNLHGRWRKIRHTAYTWEERVRTAT